MSESDAIERADQPLTVEGLASDLHSIGLGAGETVIVHSSLSAIGWVAGGAQAVVDALMRVVTADGTVVVPTHTGQYTDPSEWEHPPVPDDWVPIIRESMPPYRPDVTPSRGMGAIPECFRTYPGTIRSRHPLYSFAAWGTNADAVVGDHGYDDGLGEESPLARLYDLDASVLLLGVGHANNTAIHLAEYRSTNPKERSDGEAPILRAGERTTVRFEDIPIDSDDFEALGADFERDHGAESGRVGIAEAKLMDVRPLVDYAVGWMETNRT